MTRPGRHRDPPDGRRVTLPAVLEFDPLRDSRHRTARAAREQADWLAALAISGIRPRTLEDYERWTAAGLVMFPQLDFAALMDDGVLVHIFKTWPVGSRRVRIAPWQNWARWGVMTRRIDRNPFDYIERQRRQPRKPVDVYTRQERAQLEALPSPDGPLMTFLFGSGVRKAEARRARARHVDLDRGVFRVIDGKGGKDRDVPIETPVVFALSELFTLEGINPDDYLWHTRPGGGTIIRRHSPIGEASFVRWWNRCVKDAGVRYLKPHTTRHTFATHWRQDGMDIGDVAILIGDTIEVAAEYYDHSTVADVAERMARLRAR